MFPDFAAVDCVLDKVEAETDEGTDTEREGECQRAHEDLVNVSRCDEARD